jgi:beta-mannanase
LVRLVDRARFGSYVNLPGVQANPIPSASLEQFEALLGRRFDIVHYFFDWSSPFAAAINANVPDRDLMISWAPPGAAFAQILAGSFDAYIANYARAAKAYRHPVYLRLAGEMNGNWNSYSSAAADGPSAKSFKLAWHRVVGIFRAVHAKNVKFIWCPTEVDSPDVAGNHLEDYWPGSNYVDVLGFDSYNRSVGGKIEGGGGWRTFNEMCASGYGRVAALDDSMPIWLCETGCTEAVFGDPVGVTKGAWFNSMFQSESYPRLSAVVYFSSDDTSLARDWRIDTTAESVQGWKRGWHS